MSDIKRMTLSDLDTNDYDGSDYTSGYNRRNYNDDEEVRRETTRRVDSYQSDDGVPKKRTELYKNGELYSSQG